MNTGGVVVTRAKKWAMGQLQDQKRKTRVVAGALVLKSSIFFSVFYFYFYFYFYFF